MRRVGGRFFFAAYGNPRTHGLFTRVCDDDGEERLSVANGKIFAALSRFRKSVPRFSDKNLRQNKRPKQTFVGSPRDVCLESNFWELVDDIRDCNNLRVEIVGTTIREYGVKRCIPTVIIEPRALQRVGLASLLNDSNFKVVASIATPDELPPLPRGRMGLILIGLSTGSCPNLGYFEKSPLPAQGYKIVVVADASGKTTQPYLSRLLSGRIDGYILNVSSREVLLKSLDLAILEQKLVVLGDNCVPATVADSHAKPIAYDDIRARTNGHDAMQLSERELNILRRLAYGDSNKIIGRICRIAESTVKIHLKSILRKIHVQNRTQAAVWAIQNGLGTSLGPAAAATTNTQPDDTVDLLVAKQV